MNSERPVRKALPVWLAVPGAILNGWMFLAIVNNGTGSAANWFGGLFFGLGAIVCAIAPFIPARERARRSDIR